MVLQPQGNLAFLQERRLGKFFLCEHASWIPSSACTSAYSGQDNGRGRVGEPGFVGNGGFMRLLDCYRSNHCVSFHLEQATRWSPTLVFGTSQCWNGRVAV